MTTIMHFAGTLQRRPTTLRLPLGVLSRCPACQALPPPGGLLARCAQGQRERGTFMWFSAGDIIRVSPARIGPVWREL